MVWIVMVCIVTAYIAMAYIGMAYIVTVWIVMVSIVMAYILMAHLTLQCRQRRVQRVEVAVAVGQRIVEERAFFFPFLRRYGLDECMAHLSYGSCRHGRSGTSAPEPVYIVMAYIVMAH